MKKLIYFLIPIFAGLTSCDLIDELIPDVDTDYENTFTITISDNQGSSDTVLVDVSSSSEYNDFKDNIDRFEITDITVEVMSYDGPDDIYFSGQVLVMDTMMTTEMVVGDIMRYNISDIILNDTIFNVEEKVTGIEQLSVWLEEAGKFYTRADYVLTDAMGDPYPIGENEYNLEIRLKYYVTVITVAGKDEEEE